MTDKEAMAMALEALECANSPNGDYENEIAALKTRLAQEKALQALHDENARLGLYKDAYGQPEQEPLIGCVNHDCDKCKERTEQEPVAWMDADGNVSDNNDHKCFPIPLYTKEQP